MEQLMRGGNTEPRRWRQVPLRGRDSSVVEMAGQRDGRTQDWYGSHKIRSLLVSHLLSEVGRVVGRVEVGTLK